MERVPEDWTELSVTIMHELARSRAGPGSGLRERVPPELNSVERLWLVLRNRTLSNRAFANIQDLEASAAAALCALTPQEIRSTCATPWLEAD